jgi:hypothetical protein
MRFAGEKVSDLSEIFDSMKEKRKPRIRAEKVKKNQKTLHKTNLPFLTEVLLAQAGWARLGKEGNGYRD